MSVSEVINLMQTRQGTLGKTIILEKKRKTTLRRERSIIPYIRILTMLFIIIALTERQYGNQKANLAWK